MTSIDTRVQMLNLRAPDEAMTQRLSSLVEEALRLAVAEGDIPARVFVIRSLDLSAIPRAATSATVTQAVDSAVQRIIANAVPGDDPAASVAPMVYFKDEGSVVLALAQRVANNRPSTEWFWPSVVKGWTPSIPTDRVIPLLIERALATPGGVITLARVIETLASTGALDRLLERLSPSDGRKLLEAIGWTERAITESGRDAEHSDPHPSHPPARAEQLVQRWVGRWGGDARDPRALWLGAMVLVADHPARATQAELPQHVRAWLAAVSDQSRQAARDEARDGATIQAMRREDLIADARAWLQSNPRSSVDSLFGGGPPLFRTSREPIDNEPVQRRTPDDRAPSSERDPDALPTWSHPRDTRYAGFLFLVPVLTRVGLTRIVADNPELLARDWPTALLLRLARRLAIPHDDPAVVCLAGRPANIAHADRSLTAEVLRAMRIRVRNEAGVTLRTLVHRDGAIVASRTEIDVLLHWAIAHDGARRAGLDTDPAHTAWIGRSVVFHYHDAIDLNA